MEILKKRGKIFLSGNESIVRGSLESGINFASTYPGTPASGIGDAFAKIIKKYPKFYFEYSTNEKVALETGAGAAFSGLKSLVSVKHYGLNVASDSLMPLVYLSCPLVVVVADDPGCWSSVQTEQDSRWYSRLAHIPTLEPSDSQEAKEMTKFAFSFAFKYKIPVLIRLTTRVCYSKSLVNLNEIKETNKKGKFIKKEFKMGPSQTVFLHEQLLKKLEKIKRENFSFNNPNNKFNFIENKNNINKYKIGIVTSGVSYLYVKEALQELDLKLPMLKLGFTYPFPEKIVEEFTKNLDSVIVVEELDPIVEEEIKRIKRNIKIYGKKSFDFPETNELKPEDVLFGIFRILNRLNIKTNKSQKVIKVIKAITRKQEPVEKRLPLFCAGCPHRAVFYAVKKVLGKKFKKTVFGGDIGCYMLSAYKPYNMQDYIVSMGASIGIGHGISKANSKEKPIIFIGDSTFFHAGIPGLINLVFNKANALVIVMDNRWTAMTGHQPNPGTGLNASGKAKAIDIEAIAKACQVDFVKTSYVYNFNQLYKDIKEAYSIKGVSVIVAKGECRLAFIRRITKQGIKLPRFEIIKQKPELEQLKGFGCPAISKKNGKWQIDKSLCWSCSICKQLFPKLIEQEKNQSKKSRKK